MPSESPLVCTSQNQKDEISKLNFKTPHCVNVRRRFLRQRGYKNVLEWSQVDKHLYIGRPSDGANGVEVSKWRNPYTVNKYGRERCLALYEQHIRDNLMNDLAELEGKVLGCWCKPEPCHGDVLIKLFKEKFPSSPQTPLPFPHIITDGSCEMEQSNIDLPRLSTPCAGTPSSPPHTLTSEGRVVTAGRDSVTQDQNSVIQINDDDDPKSLLQNLKAKNKDRPIIAHLNINFLDPKFDPLQDIIKYNVDILLVSETKLDDTFPCGKFFIEGYKEPIRLDRNRNGGGLLFFIRDDLDSKEIKSHKLPKKS